MRHWRSTILSGLVLWLGLPLAGAQALTLAQLETRTRTYLRDTAADTNFQRFSQAQIDDFINEGQRQMQNDGWLYQGSFNMDLVAGTIEYALPADYITTVRVTVANRALTEVSFNGLDQDQTNWTVSQSTPTEYFIDPYVTGAPPNIGFFMNPKYTTSGGAVFVQYVRQVPALVNPGDIPFGGNAQLLPYNDALADFAAAEGWMLLGRQDLATGYMQVYSSRAAQARANLNKEPNWQPGATGARNSVQSGDQP